MSFDSTDALQMSDFSPFQSSSPRLLWYGLLGASSLLVVLALLPPLLSFPWRATVMEAFAPVCHQMPSRSLHLGGVPIAICDRCLGIYLGVVGGVATVKESHVFWSWLGNTRRYFFLASLAPLVLDWAGPIIGLWGNVPSSRFLTGLFFGMVAASFVTDRLLQQSTRAEASKGFDVV